MKYLVQYADDDQRHLVDPDKYNCDAVEQMQQDNILSIIREDQVLVSPQEFAERVHAIASDTFREEDSRGYHEWGDIRWIQAIQQAVAELEGEGVKT